MRIFELHRDRDETGVSGTGIVAEGVVFHDGSCALRWRTEHRSTAVYATLQDVEHIHCHHGATRVVFPFQATGDRLYERAVNCPPGEGTDAALAAIACLRSLA